MQLKNVFFSVLALGTVCSAAIAHPNHVSLSRKAVDSKSALVDPVVNLHLTLTVPIKEIVGTVEATLATVGSAVDLTESAVHQLSDSLKPYIDDITDAVESTAEYLVSALQKGTLILTDDLKAAAQAVGDALALVLKKLEMTGELVMKTLKEEVYGLAQAGMFLFGQLEHLVEGLAKAIQGTVEELVVRANKVGADVDGLLFAIGKSLGQILHDLLFG
ncbi:unnamed protein product [Tilletia controversa]|uniref:Cell wall mannoprotein 1 n=3 Tax=Tilletia TaxID=13289 RepID=A0A8X7N2A5_9BASI|nr:hypothetical protein CF336_g1607 [Tilletia laevis]KAE8206230.1 hypothetical protein CF328_g49 [Tilletia controversa]KAE8263944.1 hypothetical protein A4X03_0g1313 [Tilletia caries]KAE8207752.1 hypothetical protein CF335_g918 [Tilletia laevis]KAE8256209.1 hypothetical protein A4X06_0g19 [Tilletia controversa]